MEQLICHLIGDYIFQSDWMANEKTKKSIAAAVHAITYTLPFLALTWSSSAVAFICVTHFVIDRWRLARFVCWAKNFLAPRYTTEKKFNEYTGEMEDKNTLWWFPWDMCDVTGYNKDRPAWLAVWLLIITDNTMHLLCNYAALRFLT